MLVESSRQATLIAGEVGEKKLTFDASSAEFGQDESLPYDLPTYFFLESFRTSLKSIILSQGLSYQTHRQDQRASKIRCG